ncbi:MAG: GerW family sporulation protein [Oscillospiraceae bacterium]
MNSSNLTENVNSLFHSLENFTQNEGIIGKPVTQGDKTFLPVVSITVGYGGGNTAMGNGKQGSTASMGTAMGSSGSDAGALGLGAKLSTDAIIVIDQGNVSMLPMSSNVSTLMDKIPQIISGINQNKQSGQAQGQNQNQNAGQ